MTRIAIIDHESHSLFVEDIPDETLEQYNDEEESFIKATHPKLKNFSWDYITNTQYMPHGSLDIIDEKPAMKRILKIGEPVWWQDDHMSGWGRIGLVNGTESFGEYNVGPDDIITVCKSDGGEIETTYMHVFQLAPGRFFNEKPLVWDHFSEDFDFWCPDEKTLVTFDMLDCNKTFEVDLFILGTPPVLTKETVTVDAPCAETAEQIALRMYDGYGVLASRLKK